MSNDFVYVTYIYSTSQKVWDAITKPEFAKRYWFHYNVSDWKKGSRWEHQHGDDSGKIMIDGTVLETDPPRKLVITWTRPDKSKEPSRVIFDIADDDSGFVRLTVTHDQLEHDPAMAASVCCCSASISDMVRQSDRVCGLCGRHTGISMRSVSSGLAPACVSMQCTCPRWWVW